MDGVGTGNTAAKRGQAPFTVMTDHKQNSQVYTDGKGGQIRVPPILLANENKMKYVGNKHQTQVMNKRDFGSPHNKNSSPGRFGTANAASFLSRDPASTAYSQPEDSMF